MKKYPVFTPIIGENEKKYINDCLDTNWVSQGKYVSKFEEAFSSFCECDFGVATANCTTALHLSCIALGLKEGDEVLVSSSTNMASAFSIKYTGAEPVPVDIKRTNWQMNSNLVEPLINSRTKAIMVVHLFGHPVDMDPIVELAKKYNLKIIEDCAEAHGATYNDRPISDYAHITSYSTENSKHIATGREPPQEGGVHDLIFNAVLTDNSMFQMIRILNIFWSQKTLVASAIGIHMDEKGPFSSPPLNP